MGGHGKGDSTSVGKGRGGQTWLEATRDRLNEWGKPETGKGRKGEFTGRWMAPVRERAWQAQRQQTERTGVFSRPPEDEEDDAAEPDAMLVGAETVHAAALRSHRMVEGRRASGFEPQRNTFYILGRPVQVFGPSKKIKFSCQL